MLARTCLSLIALSYIAASRPLGHYEGLAETYIEAFGSNVVANDTTTAPPPPTKPSTDADKTDPSCKRFIMPPVPQDCLQKSGEIACIGLSLYCRFPTDWGVGYDPIGECWSGCK
ncbi:hypothetical protein F4776DRAFT_642290 [Hypoxylon sp. NC0597]|nr:hypothetical protein F4776DRAFT_642290 [Hypoxylon sp. NC0597]